MKAFYFVILFMLAVIFSCQPNAENNVVHHYDTVKSVVRTDTGDFLKVSYQFDGMETCSELRRASRDGEGKPFLMYAYGYDTLGNKILTICSVFNQEKKDYVHLSKEENEFDATGVNPTLTTHYIEKRGHWFPDQRFGRTYDAKGNVITLETYEPGLGDEWTIKSKTYFKYDNAGNVTEKTDFSVDEKGEWRPVEKFQREYNKSNITMEIIYEPTRNNDWKEKSKAEYEYNNSHQCSATTSYIKRGSKWVNYVRSEYTFDAGGMMLSCDTYFWNERTGKWVFHDKEEY
ncbi:MAG: hypothetical protein J6U21_10660 [Bacteroidales bacterium]|nr:hypothetical protein [Bacteroidales bacterium]